jgi:hypothetical protein
MGASHDRSNAAANEAARPPKATRKRSADEMEGLETSLRSERGSNILPVRVPRDDIEAATTALSKLLIASSLGEQSPTATMMTTTTTTTTGETTTHSVRNVHCS